MLSVQVFAHVHCFGTCTQVSTKISFPIHALMKNVASTGYICSRMQLTESSFSMCIDEKCCTYWIYTCSRQLTKSSFSMCIDEKCCRY